MVARSCTRGPESKGGVGPYIKDFVHPEQGLARAPEWHQRVHAGITNAARSLDRALA
ncbi:MAG: hypothetical protein R3B89_22110 [Polyangiaceae bacterium]